MDLGVGTLCDVCTRLCITDDTANRHHPSLDTLQTSAQQCHLCYLMLISLLQKSTPLDHGEIQSTSVTVKLGMIENTFLVLALIIRCGDRQAKLWIVQDDPELK